MFVLLVGPKGSGKSHIGRILEKHLGVHFFPVEPLWMRYHAECREAGRTPVLSEGIARVHPRIVEALQKYEHVCVETTGASVEILEDLLALQPPSKTRLVRVNAPLEICLERIAARDQTHQIPMDVEAIRQVYALSEAASLQPDLTLENISLDEAEIVALFQKILQSSAKEAS